MGTARAVGVGGELEGGDRRFRGMALEIEAQKGEQRLDVAGEGGEGQGALVVTVGLELQGELEALTAQGLTRHPPGETLEGSAGEKDEGLEIDQRPLELQSFAKGRRRLARHQGPRIFAAGEGLEIFAVLAETADDLGLGQRGELAQAGCGCPSCRESPGWRPGG